MTPSTNEMISVLIGEPHQRPIGEMYAGRENMHSQHMRKALNGSVEDTARKLRLKLSTVKTRVECEVFLDDVADILEDLSHHEDYRKGDRTNAYAHSGAAIGSLGADRGSEFGGALFGLGAGLLAAHFIKDDAASKVNATYKEVKKIQGEAKDKMLKLKK